jgi:hypothetical protein
MHLRTSRRAALKARRSLATHNDAGPSSSGSAYTHQPTKSDIEATTAIKEAIRNRKTRLAKLRDLAKDLSDEPLSGSATRNRGANENQRCPVCSQEVPGSTDEAVMVAHVDACILEAATTAEQSRLWNESRAGGSGDSGEYEVGGERRIRVTDLAGFRGRRLSVE